MTTSLDENILAKVHSFKSLEFSPFYLVATCEPCFLYRMGQYSLCVGVLIFSIQPWNVRKDNELVLYTYIYVHIIG